MAGLSPVPPLLDEVDQFLTGYEVALRAIVAGASAEQLDILSNPPGMTLPPTDRERAGFRAAREQHEGKVF